MKDNTPQSLFKLARDCPITKGYLDAWLDGRLPFYECLIHLHDSLATRCINLNSRFNLSVKYLDDLLKVSEPAPISPFSAVMDIPQKSLAHQKELIGAINFAHRVMKGLETVSLAKHQLAPVQIIKYNDGHVEFLYNDRIKNDLPNPKLPTEA